MKSASLFSLSVLKTTQMGFFVEENKAKLAVIVPYDSPSMLTVAAFNMLNWKRPDDCEVKFIMGSGWCPAARHNDGVEKARAWGAGLILFNGADHLCSFDIIERMISRINEGWDIVQAVIPSRGICGLTQIPFDTTSYRVIGPMPKENPLINTPIESIKIIHGADEPQETHISGTGNIMMKADIFDGLQKPYFFEYIVNDEKYSRIPMMDSNFVYRCTKGAGAKMFCDTGIKLRHLDLFAIDETYQERFKDKTGVEKWSPAKDIREFV